MTYRATINLNPNQIIGEVDDHLYGANLEHIGQSIYGGVWAELLRDRKFAGHDRMYTGPSEGLHNAHPSFGVVVPWSAVNPGPSVRFSHDNTTFYTGRQSQRITIQAADDEWHGIQQSDLYLQQGMMYQVRLVLKGSGQVVRLQLGDAQAEIHDVSPDWQTYQIALTPAKTTTRGDFGITIHTAGDLWVGCTSVMPSDHTGGFRADVVAALREWQPTFLRWPGGNFVSAYHWQNGLGDRDQRPAYLDPAWQLWESNDVGTDEFMSLCRLVGSEPVLTVNMGDDTPESAANWVEYCNGDQSTHYGRLRQQNGHAEPYDVKTWFVGNEQFGNWQVGHVDPQTYARRYLEFAAAMRAVDPDLTLIAVGVPTNLYGDWNQQVLQIAGDEIDQLSVHYYSIRTEKWDKPPSAELLYMPKIAASHEVAQMLDDTIRIMDHHSPRKLPLAFDEWNTYSGAKSPDFIEHYNLADALYTGALMNACIKRSDRVKCSAIFNLINVMGSYLVAPLYEWAPVNLGRGGGWVPVGVNNEADEPAVIKAPSTLVLELMTAHRGSTAIHCDVTSPTYTSPAAGTLSEMDDVPILDAAATCDPDQQMIFLSLVNRSIDQAVAINLEGLLINTFIEAYSISADTPLAMNTIEQPQAISVESMSKGELAVPFEVPPHTFMLVSLQYK